MSCIVGAMRASYHVPQGTYNHNMGIKESGNMAILAGAGPMGMGLVDLTLHGDRRPKNLVVTDIDDNRLHSLEKLFTTQNAKKLGIKLTYINTKDLKNPVEFLRSVNDNQGFDDVFVMAPVSPLVEQADRLLDKDGCMNFFSGPTNTEFSANINFYDMHYAFHHIVGTSGGNTEDMKISLRLMEEKRVNPAIMITHIGGLNSVAETTLNLPNIGGGKKLIYTQIDLPLTAISDFEMKGENDLLFKALYKITNARGGLWCKEAEDYLLENGKTSY